jgi:hypothetical protein
MDRGFYYKITILRRNFSAAVTAMTTYIIRRNESMLITGHEDASIAFHKVAEHLYIDHGIDDMFVLQVETKVTILYRFCNDFVTIL